MKQIILTFMAAVMITTSAFAMSPAIDTIDGNKDYISVQTPITDNDTVVIEADDISDWDYFWGTTLNPQTTGWNDFWFQCQDPNKTVGDCIGTVSAGLGLGIAAAVVVTGVIIASTAAIPMASTSVVWVQPAFGTFSTASM